MAINMSDNNWLPSIMPCPDLNNWQSYEDSLYKIYLDDLFHKPPQYLGKVVKTKYHPPYKNKAYSFWHLTHEVKVENERTPDLRRCERLCWIKPVITNYQDLISWVRPDKNNRHYIWHKNEKYLIVLQPIKDFYLLVTAFQVGETWRADRYTQEAEKYA